MPDLDVTGIGNAIVDVLSHAEESAVEALGLSKGGMTLIDEARAHELYRKMDSGVEMSGGSAANTLAGLGSLGGKCAFMGKVADDALGEVFRHDIQSMGTRYETTPLSGGLATARCLIFVTPDAQRTMNTFLGASVEFGPEDIDEEAIASSKITYLEGYLWDPPKAKQAFVKAAELAHANSRKIALSLSDAFCVDRHRDSFLDLIDGHVDILFANDAEIMSLFECSFEDAVSAVAGKCEVIALTRGEKGSVVLAGGQTVEVEATPPKELVDTTGAGDQYAAGFLYAWCRDYPMAACGRLGGIAAAEVISHYGARPEVELKTLIPSDF